MKLKYGQIIAEKSELGTFADIYIYLQRNGPKGGHDLLRIGRYGGGIVDILSIGFYHKFKFAKKPEVFEIPNKELKPEVWVIVNDPEKIWKVFFASEVTLQFILREIFL